MKLYSVAASFELNKKDGFIAGLVEANVALAKSPEEAEDWFAGYIEKKYPPSKGYGNYIYDTYEIPEELR